MVQDVLDSWHADQAGLQVKFIHPFHPQSAGQPTHTEGWEMQGSREMGEYYHPPKIIAALVLIC